MGDEYRDCEGCTRRNRTNWSLVFAMVSWGNFSASFCLGRIIPQASTYKTAIWIDIFDGRTPSGQFRNVGDGGQIYDGD